jgi:hypothetical protein
MLEFMHHAPSDALLSRCFRHFRFPSNKDHKNPQVSGSFPERARSLGVGGKISPGPGPRLSVISKGGACSLVAEAAFLFWLSCFLSRSPTS